MTNSAAKHFFAVLRKYFPLSELILLVVLLILVNNFFKKNDRVIQADGLGYYHYLPATFIYKDLSFQYLDTLKTELYNHQTENDGIIRKVNHGRVNKYYLGTALMQTPFFLIAHQTAKFNDDVPADGYSSVYQNWLYYAALFYALLGLYFVKLTFRYFEIHDFWSFLVQGAILFASSLVNYIVTDPAFSHVYSFALISIWVYLILTYTHKNPKKLLWIALVLGLIVLVRPINIIVLIFIPFLVFLKGDNMRDVISYFSNKLILISSAFLFFLVVSIQFYVWHTQCGQWYVSSYGDEGFNFSDSHFFDFLFSYRKGFFIYAPIFLLVMLLGLIHWIREKSWYLVLSFIGAFSILIYVLSSWWYWSYGASFGSRVMIDFYPLIILAIVPLLRSSRWILKLSLIPFIGFASYAAVIQTYQYKNYIITWDSMTEADYWRVFMQTDDKYRGLLWQEKWNPDLIEKELFTVNYSCDSLMQNGLYFNVEMDKNYNRIAVLFRGNCSDVSGKNRVLLSIDNLEGVNQYYHEQRIFMGHGELDYRGPFELVYYISSLDQKTYLFNMHLLRDEDINCEDDFQISVFGLR